MKGKTYWFLSILAIGCAPAFAGTISYSDSGTFSASTAASAFSGPDETWSFSFQTDTNPTPVEFGNGGFDLPFSDFSYTLNGSPVAITPTAIRFFTASNGGGFFICFIEACGGGVFPSGLGTGFDWPQMFTGTTSAPVLTSGAFSGDFAAVVDPTSYNEPDTTILGLLNLQGGTTSAPVFVVGTTVGGIGGTISGQGAEDYYSFDWGGGAFSATASISGAPSGASYVYSAGVAGTCSSLATQTLNSGDGFTGTISSGNLVPGQYCIGLDANNANDPTFALVFNTPVSGVPEPSTLLLSTAIGLMVVPFARRRRFSCGNRQN